METFAFYISRTKARIYILSAGKRYKIFEEKLKFQIGFRRAFSNYVIFIPACIRLLLVGPANFDFISYGHDKRGKPRWIIIKA